MVKVAVITGSSASGLACMQKLLSNNAKNGVSLVRGCFRMQGKAATTRSSLPLNDAETSRRYESVAHVDAANVDSLRKALKGMDRALLVTPLDYSAGLQEDAQKSINMVQAAQDVGVQRIVHVGSWTVNAPTQLPILSARFVPTETFLREDIGSSMQWTVLRGGYFMGNFAHVHAESIKTQKMMLPLPDCQIPPVHIRDIGEAAAALLEDDTDEYGYDQTFVECCGPNSFSHSEIAAELSAGLGMPVEYPKDSVPPLSEWTSENPVLSELYKYMAAADHDGNGVPYDPEPFAKLLGRPLTPLKQWASENKHGFT